MWATKLDTVKLIARQKWIGAEECCCHHTLLELVNNIIMYEYTLIVHHAHK